MAGKRWTFSIRLGVVSVFILATVLTASIAIGLHYYFSYQQSLQAAKVSYHANAEQTASHLEALDRKASQLVQSLSRYPRLTDHNGQISATSQRLLAEALSLNPEFYALYLGFGNGDFYELVNLAASTSGRRQLQAEEQDRWVLNVMHRQSDPGQELRFYLDEQLQVRRQQRLASDYDPRSRPWYRQANSERVNKTAPYLFDTLDAPGQTYSLRLPASDAVLGLDITLASFTDYLRQLSVDDDTELYLYDDNGALIASNAPQRQQPLDRLPDLPLSEEQQALVAQLSPLTVSNELDWPPVDFAVAGKPAGYAIDMLAVLAAMTGLELDYINGHSWTELLAMFRRGEIDILQPVLHSSVAGQDGHPLGLVSEPFIQLPFALAHHADRPVPNRLAEFTGQTLAIGEGWSVIAPIRQAHPQIEIKQYPSTLAAMQAVAAGEADAALDNGIVLHFHQRHYFLEALQIRDATDLGLPQPMDTLHLIVQHDQQALLALLDHALAHIPEQTRQQLHETWLGNTRILSQYTGTLPYPQLLQPDNDSQAGLQQFSQHQQAYFAYARALDGEHPMHFAAVAPREQITGPATRHALWTAAVTSLAIVLLLPAAGLFAAPIVRPIKRLEAQSQKVKERQYGEICRIHTQIKETEQLAQSLYDMAQSIRQHEQNQQALLDSFIQLIAEAIDEKSAHTGAHCARVPELGMMLAEAASDSNDGVFSNFSLADADRKREFRIAAWLHDCGKITTPEQIIDKGAKLETLYNRIHEIRTRFEVLWRDAEIHYLKACAASPDQAVEHQQQWQARQQQLQAQFHFIARANLGGEAMSEADKAEVDQIAAQTWQRHFDDRLGLSPLDCRRLPPRDETLPVSEPLLADKPEHRIPHEHTPHYPEHLGIRMDIPEYRANQGECYNLKIERGTLSEEDRFKVNEHIINTIRMLDRLPFPKELARVPRYASTHHERLDGLGYPRRLAAEQLEIPDRILAVADVFEALTAADRPYKDAKTLSQSLTIMARMVAEQHLDRDVFALFLRSGVYLRYARQYLREEQIDRVEIDDYLN